MKKPHWTPEAKLLIKAIGDNVGQVAENSGVHKTIIYDMIRGLHDPTDRTVARLAKALNLKFKVERILR